MELDDLRKEINNIDTDIIDLLEERMNVSKKISSYKTENNIEVLNINRELTVISNIKKSIENHDFEQAIANIYFKIMKESRGLQENNKLYNYGLLGNSLSHSISPSIHNNLFSYNNQNNKYGIFEIDSNNLRSFVENLVNYGIKGFQVTIPYKVEIIKYLDGLDEIAKDIGSVNTVKIVNGKKIGYNTDYFGFKKLLEYNNISVENKNVLILGNGGSSKTCKYYCEKHNANNVYIISRKNKNINEKIFNYSDIENLEYDIIINTTPVGMFPNSNESPIDYLLVQRADVVIDIIYNPKTTKLLELANNKKTANGLDMLFAQAIKAQEIWELCNYKNKYMDLLKNSIIL